MSEASSINRGPSDKELLACKIAVARVLAKGVPKINAFTHQQALNGGTDYAKARLKYALYINSEDGGETIVMRQ